MSKLGAKKAGTAINFEEAQKKAMEEEERVKRLGYDKAREEEEARAIKEREAEERKKAGQASSGISRGSTPVNGASGPGAASRRVEEKVVPVRLGFGQTAGQAAVAPVKT